MSDFTRPAPWLRQLFTPSKTESANPGKLSNDVSLTHPYDGGGWPLTDPNSWATRVVTAAVALADTVLVTTGENEIFRILAVSAQVSAGVHPDMFVDISTATFAVGISAQQDGASPPPAPTNAQAFFLTTPIMGPSQSLRGKHLNGDAATVVDWRVYGVIAPIGTCFYI